MSNPITTVEAAFTCERHERQWTYEEMLELFSDDGNLVRPLVLRCMEYESQLTAAAEREQRVRALLQEFIDASHKAFEKIKSANGVDLRTFNGPGAQLVARAEAALAKGCCADEVELELGDK